MHIVDIMIKDPNQILFCGDRERGSCTGQREAQLAGVSEQSISKNDKRYHPFTYSFTSSLRYSG